MLRFSCFDVELKVHKVKETKREIKKMPKYGIRKGWYKCSNCDRKWTSACVRTSHGRNGQGLMQKKCAGCKTMVGPYRLVSLGHISNKLIK